MLKTLIAVWLSGLAFSMIGEVFPASAGTGEEGYEIVVLPTVTIKFGNPGRAVLHFRNVRLDDFLLVSKKDGRGMKILHHGKLTIEDLINGVQDGSPSRLSGEIDLPIELESYELLSRMKLSCSSGDQSIYITYESPWDSRMYDKFREAAVLLPHDCVEGKLVEREVHVFSTGGL